MYIQSVVEQIKQSDSFIKHLCYLYSLAHLKGKIIVVVVPNKVIICSASKRLFSALPIGQQLEEYISRCSNLLLSNAKIGTACISLAWRFFVCDVVVAPSMLFGQNIRCQIVKTFIFPVIKDLKDFMRQAGDVTYADAHKTKRNEGTVEFASFKVCSEYYVVI